MGAAGLFLDAAMTLLFVSGAVRWSVSAVAVWRERHGATVLLIIS